MNILSQIIQHGDRDDLECILATILNVFERLEPEEPAVADGLRRYVSTLLEENAKLKSDIRNLTSGNAILKADMAKLERENERLDDEAAAAITECTRLKADIEGLRKIINNERAATGDPRPVWEYMP